MTKETIAILGLGLSLIAAVFGFGVRIGTLTERIEAQSKQIDGLSTELRAINSAFIAWASSHTEPPAPSRRTR